MNKISNKLAKMIKENPDLPIVPMVDGEVSGEFFGYYEATIEDVLVSEFTIFDEEYIYDKQEFKDLYYDYNYDDLNEKFGIDKKNIDDSKQKLLKAYLEDITEKAFRKAILIYIGLKDE